jgi:hypothetical protein
MRRSRGLGDVYKRQLHTFKTTEQITQILDATYMEQLKLTRIANLTKASRSRRQAKYA